ncbi:MAG: NADH-quinone oxidoreductase subunit A [Deltaproteobacteria bacterium]|nr:NADH-quinone oxidoreductase subunit A [Deltaproteobacteria bacterium]
MLTSFLPLLIAIVFALGLVTIIAWLGVFLGPRRASPIKSENFECGNPASGDARERVNIKYFLVGILFLVFDIEAIFIYPWAIAFSDAIKNNSPISASVAFFAMLSFVAVMLVALIYAWRKGALEWGA